MFSAQLIEEWSGAQKGQSRLHGRSETGRHGEDLAADFLQSAGMSVLERNFRLKSGEIDIIVKDGDTLVFVEVKSCRSASFGEPETWVDPRKQMRIGRTAGIYLTMKGIDDVDCRFDVIAVHFHGEEHRINHIKNAFWL